MAAVIFLGETFTPVNALGLCILILGVALFNYIKYKKLRAGESTVGAVSPRGDRAHDPASSLRLVPGVVVRSGESNRIVQGTSFEIMTVSIATVLLYPTGTLSCNLVQSFCSPTCGESRDS